MVPRLPPLFVLRHGETEWNRESRLQGHLDSPLTPLGRTQAAQQNAILGRLLPDGADADAITSDSGRAVATCAIAFEGLSLTPRIDPRLREVGLGDWQGLTLDEVAAGWPNIVRGRDPLDWKFDAPGGERLHAFEARIRAVLAEIDRPTVIVTHGLTSRLLRCLASGRPAGAMGALAGGQGVVHVVDGSRIETVAA